jgi:hypothetical protein
MSQTTLEEAENTQSVIGDLPDPKLIQKPVEDIVAEELEIEVKDDTPQEDRNRETMPEAIVEDLEKDELEEYSKEKGKQLKKVWHDERRAKEAAMKERDAAANFAKQILEENKTLKEHLTVGEKALIDNSKSSAAHELELAKKSFKEAYDSGDSDAVAEAQDKLVSAKMKLENAESYVPQYSEEALQASTNEVNQELVRNIPPAEAPQADPKALAWQERNKDWWGIDRTMTSLAFGAHDQLVNAGVDPSSDEYYQSIDTEMRKRFPEKFKKQEAEETPTPEGNQSQSTVVSPAKRTTSSKRVVLSNSEVRLAQRLGLTPEQYAREKTKMEA